MLPCTGERSQRHTILHVSFGNSFGLASALPPHRVCRVRQNFIFFVQPKWKIANDIPGSGNTRNIGGITNIQKLINGQGPFAELGEEVFDDYWQGYFNKVDARTAGIGTPHYNNLNSYKEYLKSQANKLSKF